MKTFPKFFAVVVFAMLVSACSRQTSNITSSQKMQTVASLNALHSSAPVVVHAEPVAKDPQAQPDLHATSTSICEASQQYTAVVSRKTVQTRIKKDASKALAMIQPANTVPVIGGRNALDRDYPQVNKAGAIFIIAGILGLILKLIPIACYVLIAIGLIVLLSPLFHKRYER